MVFQQPPLSLLIDKDFPHYVFITCNQFNEVHSFGYVCQVYGLFNEYKMCGMVSIYGFRTILEGSKVGEQLELVVESRL
jgi:hypothetical protein